MRWPRLSIAGMIGGVAFFGLAFAGLRSPTEFVAGCAILLTLVVLLSATLGALRRPEPGRTFWLGFALFGGAYAGMTIGPLSGPMSDPLLPTSKLLAELYFRLHWPGNPYNFYANLLARTGTGTTSIYSPAAGIYFIRIGHSLLSLLFGAAGGALARVIADRGLPATSDEVRSGA